jgi:hypothetical protein
VDKRDKKYWDFFFKNHKHAEQCKECCSIQEEYNLDHYAKYPVKCNNKGCNGIIHLRVDLESDGNSWFPVAEPRCDKCFVLQTVIDWNEV